jgi:plasmid stabilization system protein ParE
MTGAVATTFADSAVRDLEEIISYYTAQAVPQVGRRLVAEIIADIELLAEQPDRGRIVVSEFELEYLRELIRQPFRIVYRLDKKQVRVVRVWRSERLLKLP